MKLPLISVIIPTFESRGGLGRAIDSVLQQDYDNLEIIVVDDNNPNTAARESTEDLMKRYLNNPIVKYVKHERNINGAAARNTGIREAKGEYIAFLDDDDEWLPPKLTTQYNLLQEKKECDCAYCYAYVQGKQEWTIPYEGNAIIPLLMNRTKMFTPSLLFTKKSLTAIRGFDESFKRHQDYELLVRFFSHGFKICCARTPLIVIHGLGGGRITVEDFVKLKERFLLLFANQINNLEKGHRGIKRRIIVSNYVVVFDSALASKHYRIAWNMVKKYFFISPSTFISQCYFLAKGHINRKK